MDYAVIMTRVYEFNQNAGKPLINLAYANGFPPQTYQYALKPLFDDYRVVSIHARPLWGDCPPESLTNWEQLGDDLLTGLEQFTAEPVIGIGHSVGGVATIYAAIKRPDRFRALILIEPTLLAPHRLLALRLLHGGRREARHPLIEGALRRRRSWDSTEAAYEYFKGKKLFARWPDAVIRSYAESLTPGEDGKVFLMWSPEWEAQIFRTLATRVWQLPGKLKPPTLLIHGEISDTFTQGSVVAFRLSNPRAAIATIKGAGHLVPQEQPEQVGMLIRDFVKRQGTSIS